jgi:hypothetical protein
MNNPNKKDSKTIKNDTVIELNKILKEAQTITLDSLDFNKTFKEQGKILCEIKHMLSRNNKNNDNKPFTCNPIISKKLDNASFNQLFQKFKAKNNLANGKISTTSQSIKKSIKKQRQRAKSKASNRKASSRKASSRKASSRKASSRKASSRKSSNKTKYKLNTRYPIVIIKKRTPRKNVIYLNK